MSLNVGAVTMDLRANAGPWITGNNAALAALIKTTEGQHKFTQALQRTTAASETTRVAVAALASDSKGAGQLKEKVEKVNGALNAFAAAAGGAGGEVGKLGAALGGVFGAFTAGGLVGVGIAAAGSAIALLVNHFGEVDKAADKAGEAAKKSLASLREEVRALDIQLIALANGVDPKRIELVRAAAEQQAKVDKLDLEVEAAQRRVEETRAGALSPDDAGMRRGLRPSEAIAIGAERALAELARQANEARQALGEAQTLLRKDKELELGKKAKEDEADALRTATAHQREHTAQLGRTSDALRKLYDTLSPMGQAIASVGGPFSGAAALYSSFGMAPAEDPAGDYMREMMAGLNSKPILSSADYARMYGADTAMARASAGPGWSENASDLAGIGQALGIASGAAMGPMLAEKIGAVMQWALDTIASTLQSLAETLVADPRAKAALGGVEQAFSTAAALGVLAAAAGVLALPLVVLGATLGPVVALFALMAAPLVAIVLGLAAWASILFVIPVAVAALGVASLGLIGAFASLSTSTKSYQAFQSALSYELDRVVTALEPLWLGLRFLIGVLDPLVSMITVFAGVFAGGMPVAQALFEMTKALAIGFGELLVLIGTFWNALNWLLAGGKAENPINIGSLKDSLDTLKSMKLDDAYARADDIYAAVRDGAKEGTKEGMGEVLTNIPMGYRVAGAEYDAAAPDAAGGPGKRRGRDVGRVINNFHGMISVTAKNRNLLDEIADEVQRRYGMNRGGGGGPDDERG